MPNVIVEPEEGGTFAAIQYNRVIVRGDAQLEAGEKAHDLRPSDYVVAARVRTTEGAWAGQVPPYVWTEAQIWIRNCPLNNKWSCAVAQVSGEALR